MKSVTMKILTNLFSVVLFVIAASSVNRVNAQQQRPSQRPFAAVLAKIKEKQAGRNKMAEHAQPPANKTNTTGNGNTHPVPGPAIPSTGTVPSQQKVTVPAKPKQY